MLLPPSWLFPPLISHRAPASFLLLRCPASSPDQGSPLACASPASLGGFLLSLGSLLSVTSADRSSLETRTLLQATLSQVVLFYLPRDDQLLL